MEGIIKKKSYESVAVAQTTEKIILGLPDSSQT